MADKAEIMDAVEALAVHCRPAIMDAEQRSLWLRDWANDLAEFPMSAVSDACKRWRHSGSTKFPTPGQLLPIVRDCMPVERKGSVKPWQPATAAEYAAMSVRDKISEQTILAHEARRKAGPMFRNTSGGSMGRPKGIHLKPEEMSDDWRRWSDIAAQHDAEAKRLRGFLHAREPEAAPAMRALMEGRAGA